MMPVDDVKDKNRYNAFVQPLQMNRFDSFETNQNIRYQNPNPIMSPIINVRIVFKITIYYLFKLNKTKENKHKKIQYLY